MKESKRALVLVRINAEPENLVLGYLLQRSGQLFDSFVYCLELTL